MSIFPQHLQPEEAFLWSLVGNIQVAQKHFSLNAKVYCLPPAWGDGYESIKVIGRHRKSKRFILIVISRRYIYNWRKQKVYNPQVIKLMQQEPGGSWREEALDSMLASLSSPI